MNYPQLITFHVIYGKVDLDHVTCHMIKVKYTMLL